MAKFKWGNEGGPGYGVSYIGFGDGPHYPPVIKYDWEQVVLDFYKLHYRYPTPWELALGLVESWKLQGRTFRSIEHQDEVLWRSIQDFIERDDSKEPNPVAIRFPIPDHGTVGRIAAISSWLWVGTDRYNVYGMHFLDANHEERHRLVYTDTAAVLKVVGMDAFKALRVVCHPATLLKLARAT